MCTTTGVVKAETPVTNTSKINIVHTNFQSAQGPWSLREEKDGRVSRIVSFREKVVLRLEVGWRVEQSLETAPENENVCCIYFQRRKFKPFVFVSLRLGL